MPVHHEAGRVEPLLVNERIVEQPFVFAALAGLAGGARILDVGGSESTVGLSLATLGHRVTLVDPRGSPLRHPNLTHAACRLDELPGPAAGERFDAAVVLSAVEHFGLGHYGLDAVDQRLDLAALARVRELVTPGGVLVLTVPFAERPQVDDFQRVYDERGLDELLAGWDVRTSLRVGRTDRLTWQLGVASRERHGVALVTATRRAERAGVHTARVDDLKPGERFAGCRIEAVVGRGGMGVVYRATELALQRRVAVKVVAPDSVADEGFGERFGREGRLAASIDHPNVVPVFAAGQEGERLYLVMRYVDGTDLHALIGRDGRLQPARAAAIVAQLAAGLDAAHAAGLVHRDVKPANVLLTSSGATPGGDHVYLTDFGLTVEVSSDARMTTTGHWIGSVDYMAPEQLRAEPVDARTDVYALGGVLHAALTGQAPFRRGTVPQTIAAHLNDAPPRATALAPVDPVFDAVIARAMAKDPAERYGSAGDLGRAALAAVRGERVTIAERVVARGPAAPSEDATTRQPRTPPPVRRTAPTRHADAYADVVVAPVAGRPIAPAPPRSSRPAAPPPPAASPAPAPARHGRKRPSIPFLLAALAVLAATIGTIAASSGTGGAGGTVSASLSEDEIRAVALDFAAAYGNEDFASLRSTLTRNVRRVGPDGGQDSRAGVLAVYRRQFAADDIDDYEFGDVQIVPGAAGRAAGRYTVKRSRRDDITGRVAFGVVREAGHPRIALIATQPD